jgi:hypothetical protein
MSFRLVDSAWEHEFANAAAADHDDIRIVCPFIKRATLERLLKTSRPRDLRVITRFNLADFAEGG